MLNNKYLIINILFNASALGCASIASTLLLNFLNPYEFASASLSAMDSKAIRYSACMALSFIVGIPNGLVFGIFTHFNGRALYPLRVKERIASIFLASVSHFMWSTPAVRLPLLEVTFLTANALASDKVTRSYKAFTLLYLFSL